MVGQGLLRIAQLDLHSIDGVFDRFYDDSLRHGRMRPHKASCVFHQGAAVREGISIGPRMPIACPENARVVFSELLRCVAYIPFPHACFGSTSCRVCCRVAFPGAVPYNHAPAILGIAGLPGPNRFARVVADLMFPPGWRLGSRCEAVGHDQGVMQGGGVGFALPGYVETGAMVDAGA